MAAEAQCDTCGEINAADASFCLFCGAYLGWDAAPRTQGQPAQPAAPEQPDHVAHPSDAPAPSTPPPGQQRAEPGSAQSTQPQAPQSAPSTPAASTAEQPVQSVPASGRSCPTCGKDNDSSLRFCSRCGLTLTAAATGTSRLAPAAATSPQKGHFGGSEDRAARRAYRRSLPPLYRWRRVALSLLALVVLVGLAFLLAGNPVQLAKQGWYELTDRTERIEGVTASSPGQSERSPENAVDRNPSTYWARAWNPEQGETEGCAEAENAGALVLSWEVPTRVRELRVDAGLREVSDRDKQHRPRTLLVSFRGPGDSERSCEKLTLSDDPARQTIGLDTGSEVDSLTLSIGSVYPSKTRPEELGPVAIREVHVRARP